LLDFFGYGIQSVVFINNVPVLQYSIFQYSLDNEAFVFVLFEAVFIDVPEQAVGEEIS